jgi:peptide/nickel transport system permease protein
MAGFVLRGLVGRLLLAAAGASLAYLLAAASLDPRVELEGGSPHPPRAAVQARLRELNLDDRVPLAHRYATWAAGVARGDLGETLDGAAVGDELRRRAGVSLRLMAGGAALGTLGGVLAGSYAAAGQYGLGDRLLTVGAVATLSVPVFALAVLLQTGAQWLNTHAGVHMLEWTGEYTPGEAPGVLGEVTDRLGHLILPSVTIVLGQAALCARYQRGVMLDVLNAGYVRAAMARGLRRRRALRRHALRVAAIPTTTFATYGLAELLTGAAITEKTFAWHGMGEWLIDAIGRNDVNAVAACGCAAAIAIPTAGLLADLIHAALDPRVRS